MDLVMGVSETRDLYSGRLGSFKEIAINLAGLSVEYREEVGDGTAMIILTGETLAQALVHSQHNTHPVTIIRAFPTAITNALAIVEDISIPISTGDD